jgi:RNA polymerase sigma-70 factor (ECF subfamily)
MLTVHNDKAELALFQLVKQGDEEAFRLLFLRYYRLLSRYTACITKNEAEAQELVADVFVVLWEKRGSLQIGVSVRQYLYTMCRHKAFRQGKKARNISAVPLTADLADQWMDEGGLAAQPGPSAAERIYEFIDRLPGKRRLMLRMNKLEGLSYQQIAVQLGVSEKTVKNQVFRGMQQLRQMSFALFLVYLHRH